MSWQTFRKKIPFQPAAIASKLSSSSKSKSTADAEPTTDTSVVIQNTAKILIIGETGSGKLAAYFRCFKMKHISLIIYSNTASIIQN